MFGKSIPVPYNPPAYTSNQPIFLNFLLLKSIMLMSFGNMLKEIGVNPIAFGALAGTRLGSWRHY